MRQALVERAQRILDEAGWMSCTCHGCFDIAAKRESLLLLKILSNIDSLQPSAARHLRIIAANLSAAALMIGERTNREALCDGTVYERGELPTVSIQTFQQLIAEGIFPAIYRDRGGLYVRIDRELLRATRARRGLSQAELAEAVGISKKAIYEHERAQLRMVLAIAERLETLLERKIAAGIDLFAAASANLATRPKDRLEAAVGKDLAELGFRTAFVGAAPFDILAREKALLLSDVEPSKKKIARRAAGLKSFVRVAKRPALLISEAAAKNLEIPVVTRAELRELGPKELIKIAKRAE